MRFSCDPGSLRLAANAVAESRDCMDGEASEKYGGCRISAPREGDRLPTMREACADEAGRGGASAAFQVAAAAPKR
jgi:hypothetical protein